MNAQPRLAGAGTVMGAGVWLLAIGAPVLLALVISRAPIEGDDGWAIPTYTVVVTTWCLVGPPLRSMSVRRT